MSPRTVSPVSRRQPRDASREFERVRNDRGRVPSHIPDPLISKLTARCCPLETGLVIPGAMQRRRMEKATESLAWSGGDAGVVNIPKPMPPSAPGAPPPDHVLAMRSSRDRALPLVHP